MKAILGRKMGMTSVFAEDGTLYPVTVVEVLPNVVTQVKTLEKDGYVAVQVGYEEKKESRANKAEKGIAKKANTVPHYVSKELRGDEMANKDGAICQRVEPMDCRQLLRGLHAGHLGMESLRQTAV